MFNDQLSKKKYPFMYVPKFIINFTNIKDM